VTSIRILRLALRAVDASALVARIVIGAAMLVGGTLYYN